MKLWPAEANDPTVGGFIAEFDSGIRKAVSWQSEAPIPDVLEASKQYVATLISALLDGRHMHEVEGTNWASATAAVQKIISDWNDATRLRLMGDQSEAIAAATARARARH